MNVELLGALHSFAEKPTKENANRLITIPTIYKILQANYKSGAGYSSEVVGLCRWMYRRGWEILQAVSKGAVGEPMPLLKREVNDIYGDWEKVLSHLGLRSILICH